MLTFPDPNVETEYTDPNGSVWEFNGTGWVRQPESSGGGDVDLMKYACFETTYSQAGYVISGPAENHPTHLGAGDFTAQYWIKTSQNNFSLSNPRSTIDNSWGCWVDSGVLRWNKTYGVGGHIWTWGAGSIIDRRWHHIRVCRENNVHYLYVDGVDKSAELSNRNDTNNYDVPTTKGWIWGGESQNTPARATRYAGIQIVRGYSMGAPDTYLELRRPFSPCREEGAENLLCVNVFEGETTLFDIGDYGNNVAMNNASKPNYTQNKLDSPYTWNPPMRILTEEELEERLEEETEPTDNDSEPLGDNQ